MDLGPSRLMVQLEAVPNLELWYWVQGTLAEEAAMRMRARMVAFNINIVINRLLINKTMICRTKKIKILCVSSFASISCQY